MRRNLPVFLLLSCLAACLSGCSDASWPRLSDPLPDPAERERVIEHAEPIGPTASLEKAEVNSEKEAQALIITVKTELQLAKKAYHTALTRLETTQGDDQKDAWYEAQMALTRYSQTVNQLDVILNSEALAGTNSQKEANLLAEETGNAVAKERQALFNRKP